MDALTPTLTSFLNLILYVKNNAKVRDRIIFRDANYLKMKMHMLLIVCFRNCKIRVNVKRC